MPYIKVRFAIDRFYDVRDQTSCHASVFQIYNSARSQLEFRRAENSGFLFNHQDCFLPKCRADPGAAARYGVRTGSGQGQHAECVYAVGRGAEGDCGNSGEIPKQPLFDSDFEVWRGRPSLSEMPAMLEAGRAGHLAGEPSIASYGAHPA